MNESAPSSTAPKSKLPASLILIIFLATVGLVAYSQTVAYFGDESLHLVAGQLIAAGQRPYVDFFYHHTPLFAYLIGWLVAVFGNSWRVVHVFSALLTGGTLLMTAAYLYARAIETTRFITATLGVLLLVENAYVISYGTVALPYSLCLFLTVTAFVFSTECVNQKSLT